VDNYNVHRTARNYPGNTFSTDSQTVRRLARVESERSVPPYSGAEHVLEPSSLVLGTTTWIRVIGGSIGIATRVSIRVGQATTTNADPPQHRPTSRCPSTRMPSQAQLQVGAEIMRKRSRENGACAKRNYCLRKQAAA